jgi:hypothetical protein
MKTIIDLAIACAVTTWDQRTIDEDGTVIVATLPQQGDWDALEEMLGRRWTDDEDRAFSRALRYDEIMAALSDHDRGDGCLGIIVRQALADEPACSVDSVRAIVLEAEADAAADAEMSPEEYERG